MMKEKVSMELIKEISNCIQTCNWSCAEEIECYMYATINGTDDYDSMDWLYGKGKKWLEAQND